jgi:hypothetical protein
MQPVALTTIMGLPMALATIRKARTVAFFIDFNSLL